MGEVLAPGAYAAIRTGMPETRDWMKHSPSYNTEEITKDLVSHRTADQLSLYHDSQFSAFSTEVFIRPTRNTIAVVLPLLP